MSDQKKPEEVDIEAAVDVEAVTLSIPSDMKLYEMPIESTNDLRSPFFNVGFQMISYGIQIFQLSLLIVMIANNGSIELKHPSPEVIYGQIFVFWYLIFFCPSELSNYSKLRMSLFYKDTSEPYHGMMKNKEGQGMMAAVCINCAFGCKFLWNIVKSGTILFHRIVFRAGKKNAWFS